MITKPIEMTTDIDSQCCGTCTHWRGIRVVYRDYVKLKTPQGECRCPKNLRYIRPAEFNCLNHEHVKS